MHHPARAIVSFSRAWLRRTEIEFGIDIVLDERDLVAREQRRQFCFFLVWHTTSERVLERRDENAGFDLMGLGSAL